jgi:hypothetical protein
MVHNGWNMVRAALYSKIFFGFTIVQIYKFFFYEKETAACAIFVVTTRNYLFFS